MPLRRILFTFFAFSLMLIIIIGTFLYRFLQETVFEDMRNDVVHTAAIASHMISADEHEKIVSEDQNDSPEYLDIQSKLQKIVDTDSRIGSIYTYRKTDNPNIVEFVIDTQIEKDTDGNGTIEEDEMPAAIGEFYDVSKFEEMKKSFEMPGADSEMTQDKWGEWISGYAPIYDEKGMAIGAVGVDFKVDQYNTALGVVHYDMILFTTASTALALLFGGWALYIFRGASKEIVEQRNLLASIIKNAPIGIVTIEPTGQIDLINPQMARLAQLKNTTELKGKNIFNYVQANSPKLEIYVRELLKGKSFNGEAPAILTNQPKDAMRHYFGVPIFDLNTQKVIRGLLLIADVTKERRLQKQVEENTRNLEKKVNEKTNALQESLSLKNKFIHIISHQLRTPLSSALWNIEMLLSRELGPLQKEQEDFLRMTYEAEQVVVNRIQDLLLMMDAQEDRVEFQHEEFSIQSLWDSILLNFQKKARIKDITITFDVLKNSLCMVKGDLIKTRFALTAIIENALTYTPDHGKISIGVGKNEHKMRFIIKDTGIGIPQAEQKYIFDPFFRASNAALMKTDASGLGLPLAKYFIEHQGGKLWLESKEAQGTTVYVEIPCVA